MKIGLIRHYKVNYPYPLRKRLSSHEVAEWFAAYDEADIEAGVTDLQGVTWERCWTSDLPRAKRTAQLVYSGELESLEELREIPVPQFRTRIRLPFLCWGILIRLSWLIHRRTREDIRSAQELIRAVLDRILSGSGGPILIVSHAALMKYMRKELLRRGFRGPKFGYAENGKLYVFENNLDG